MDYKMIVPPLIGAAIGYVTNWIAIKMMFRPLKPYKIGKFTLPFTPGIIPKNKERIASSIASAISNELLTEEDIQKMLLSDEMKEKIKVAISDSQDKIKDSDITVKETIQKYIGEGEYNLGIATISNHLSDSIYNTIKEYNLGNIVATQVEQAAKEKMKGSVLGLLGGNSIVSSFTGSIEEKVNTYIDNNGELLIQGMVSKELDKYTSTSFSDIHNNISNSNIDIPSILMNIYENIVISKFSYILEMINISKIVEDKINEMDMLELEKLILKIMKKELNALVDLGALIGFILGLFNLLI